MAVVFEYSHWANVDGMMDVSLKGFVPYSRSLFLRMLLCVLAHDIWRCVGYSSVFTSLSAALFLPE